MEFDPAFSSPKGAKRVDNLPAEFVEVSTICKATEVVIGGRTVIGIADARDLHEGLKVGKDYTTWIKSRIAKYGFDEGTDYQILLPKTGEQTGSGGHNAQTYRLTLDMAKELAMVENNERGRRMRRYFIWAEDVARRLVTGELSQETQAIIGGIVAKAIGDLRTEMRAALMRVDPARVLVTDHFTMLDVLVKEGAVARGRRGLSIRCSHAIRRWCIVNRQEGAIRVADNPVRYMFHREVIGQWLDREGRQIIKAHNDKITGQGRLKVVVAR
jgi:anti-repressor protein